jgi:hypothetical protein
MLHHKLAAARQLGPINLTRRFLWRCRQVWRYANFVVWRRGQADEVSVGITAKLGNLPLPSYLPNFRHMPSLYKRMGSTGKSKLERIEKVSELVCSNQLELRGCGNLEFRFVTGNWYSYDNDVAIMVNRHDFLVPLVQSFELTEKSRRSLKINQFFDYWIRNFDFKNLARHDTPIDAAIRLINWLFVLNTDVLNLKDKEIKKLSKIIYLQLEYIYMHHSAGGNHLVLEALALYIYGNVFRDVERGAEWRRWGRATLLRELLRQTTEDGVHTEQSMFYHQAVCTHYLRFFLTAIAFDDDLDTGFYSRFRKMLDYVHDTTMPSLTYPVVGDGEALITSDREHWEARALLAARWKLFQETVNANFQAMIDDSTIWLLGISVDDVEFVRHDLKSKIYSDSGLAVLRDQNFYVFIDAAPFSDPEFPHHGHADALSFVACFGQDEVFTDPGGYGYYDDDLRRFFRSTDAHNTIALNGEDQSELFGVLGYGKLANAKIDAAHLSESVDHIIASHDGYSPITHGREFFLCRHPFSILIIVDHLTGKGAHNGVSRFHAADRVAFCIEKKEIAVLYSDSKLRFAFAGSCELNPIVLKGIRDERVQGWLSLETQKVVPAETLELHFNFSNDLRIVYAFTPEPGLSIQSENEWSYVFQVGNCDQACRLEIDGRASKLQAFSH